MNMLQNNLSAVVAAFKLKNPDESNKTIAAKKGVTPETVSRHVHSKIDMSMGDINDYAKILGCTEFDILFKNPPIPVMGCVHAYSDECLQLQKKQFPKSQLIEQAENGKLKTTLAHLWVTERSQPYKDKAIYLHDYYDQNTFCVYWDLDGINDSALDWQDGMIEFFDSTGFETNSVTKDSLGEYSICKLKTGEIVYGVLYQTARNRYNLESLRQGSHFDVQLEWACPSITMMTRPELRGVRWVDRDSNIQGGMFKHKMLK